MEHNSFITALVFDYNEQRPFECPCGKKYKSNPALYTHIKNKHEGKVFIFRYSLPEKSKREIHIIEKEVDPLFVIDTLDHRPLPKVLKKIYQL